MMAQMTLSVKQLTLSYGATKGYNSITCYYHLRFVLLALKAIKV